MKTKLRIATRNSPLALWQARFVAQQLMQYSAQLEIELVPMTTTGDRFLHHVPPELQGVKGLFVKELEEALLQDQADIAVHSMKDVPAIQPDGLGIVTITQRANPYDAFVSRRYAHLTDLPLHATVGTSSVRRQSQLLAFRPDLKMLPIRGNVQTRLGKLDTIPCDAIILAAAGLIRMEMQDQIQHIISEDIMLPACGQGALGIECRLDDIRTQTLVAALHDPLTTACVTAERKINAVLGGNCHIPLAVFATITNNDFHIQAKVLSADGTTVLKAASSGPQIQADRIVHDCTEHLLKQGAQQLLHSHHP